MDITEYDTLTPEEASSVLALAHRAEEYDGISPLNEDATLALSYGGGHHLLAHNGPVLIGYAFIDNPEADKSAESDAAELEYSAAQLMVDPTHRRQGIGTNLIARLAHHTDLWAFGNLDSAQYFCASHDFTPVRGLLVMELQPHVILPEAGSPSYLGDLPRRDPTPPYSDGKSQRDYPILRRWGTPPPGAVAVTQGGDPASGRMTSNESTVTISPFVPSDLENLVHLNARSFANHPEQGRMTIQDFMERMESDWFDPNGLLIARDNIGTMIGFHWTKVQNGVGEVYVLGVDPDHTGAGVGRTLLDAGLAYLTSRDVEKVRLWVDDDNAIAQSLYMESGFSPIRHDIRYRRVGVPSDAVPCVTISLDIDRRSHE